MKLPDASTILKDSLPNQDSGSARREAIKEAARKGYKNYQQ